MNRPYVFQFLRALSRLWRESFLRNHLFSFHDPQRKLGQLAAIND